MLDKKENRKRGLANENLVDLSLNFDDRVFTLVDVNGLLGVHISLREHNGLVPNMVFLKERKKERKPFGVLFFFQKGNP